MSKFKKKIIFQPAFDRRDPDPKKNYGIHGLQIIFYLIGELGAVQFILATNWQLPHVEKEFNSNNMCKYDHHMLKPLPVDIGYHSPKPMYEGQSGRECNIIPEKFCYYDGSGLNAQMYYDILRAKGSKGLWKAMKQYYKMQFESDRGEIPIEDASMGEILSFLCVQGTKPE